MGFLHELSKLLDFYSDFKNCVIMGDFNCVPDSQINDFPGGKSFL